MGNDVKVFQGFGRHGDQVCGCFSKIGFGRIKRLVSTTACIIFFFLLLTAALVPWIHVPIIQGNPFPQMIFSSRSSIKKHHSRTEYPLNCSDSGLQQKCPNNYPLVFEPDKLSTETCPDYFRWIHHDLQPWKNSGITKDMIERGKLSAELRLVIVKGELYMEKSGHPFQTRDLFTIWGILQLLRLYPGKLPDLDLLFYTGDSTKIKKRDYQGPNAKSPPPLFHYCGEEKALDIVFPDWTFWGWAEVSIMPWEQMLSAIKNGSKRTKWEDRPGYYDFFSRNLVPMQHYWPIRSTSKCKDLKFAVEWGNNHTDKLFYLTRRYASLLQAQAIGKAGSKLIEEFLTMRNIYDYMFHLLNEYAKLLKFKPTIPLKAKRVCSKTTACSREGVWREYMEQSMVKSPSDKLPCALPPPYEPQALQAFLDKKEKTIRQIQRILVIPLIIQRNPFPQMISSSRSSTTKHLPRIENPLNSSHLGVRQNHPDNYSSVFEPDGLSTKTCPNYFRWIHNDLQHWKNSGITKNMIERGKLSAELRLVIVNSELFMEKFGKPYQTRDLFTLWGILQLLQFYPGMLPDLDLLLFTGDETMIKKMDYQEPNSTSPPPLFHYCGEEDALDIVFPDWTFWGW
ncbi:Glycosyl transferase CAP10 domain - like 3 [Theobroma cacao]|nr:Glycosyl transferase CAP10 domain - like 3 [Theobroma cacao]